MLSFKDFKNDLPAGIVVFLVAVPLCLGIALASGAPLFSGIIAGFVGGIVVTLISGSNLGVSGPAAGLAVIVLNAIESLDNYEVFLVAVVLAGIIQLAMGFLKAGIIGYYFPSSVIKGMLAGIGIIIALKQIPHAFGYDENYEGDLHYEGLEGENTFTEIINAFNYVSTGAIIISVLSLLILIFWDQVLSKKGKIFQIIQGPLVVVMLGIGLNILYNSLWPHLALAEDHLVQLPVSDSLSGFAQQFTFPDFSQALTSISQVVILGFTIAIVASLETLLCLEATDKLDPYKRISPPNRELKAQGVGNIVSGLIGGLPITQVIVRSSTNIQSGGKTRLSAFIHGILILVSVMLFPGVLNLIPLASLAAILIMVGYKLAKPELFKKMYKSGWNQFLPFIVTITAIVFTDLLTGIGIGVVVAIFFILKNNYHVSHAVYKEKTPEGKKVYRLVMAEDVSFLNKGNIMETLRGVPEGSRVEIDTSRSVFIDDDVKELFENFRDTAVEKNIELTILGRSGKPKIEKYSPLQDSPTNP
ncbi:SulP family inorganic anion transporter [Cesiribacter sp. SM1]|uniref:SulP family inorganic anion transporter n=1 Tax=Cesiribacter sp. SM1 TaxID=2861196 RepID=UPI001CD77341|nr:SulP family inorganic anion transporter [Cesiribacter sp. SM1]